MICLRCRVRLNRDVSSSRLICPVCKEEYIGEERWDKHGDYIIRLGPWLVKHGDGAV